MEARDYAAVISASITSLSLIVAAFAFKRTYLTNDFNLCRSLSEEIEVRWDALHAETDSNQYYLKLVAILNHYERAAMYINSVQLMKSRSLKGLKQQVLETLSRNWDGEAFQTCFREHCSSQSTYTEIRHLMHRSGYFKVLTC
ncbi:MAG TPA: hypothetical protein VN018_06540 [Brevundimonas sp.]|nr:hypothetical protein [Brevundimonas sp.]